MKHKSREEIREMVKKEMETLKELEAKDGELEHGSEKGKVPGHGEA